MKRTKKTETDKKIIIFPIFEWLILDGIKTVTKMPISIQTDITLAIPLGSSFHPNDLIIGDSQNFI